MKIGILGGAGYTAGELIRILINHPEAEISFIVRRIAMPATLLPTCMKVFTAIPT